MHQVASRPNSPSGGNAKTQKIVIIAILLFALAGLMTGFGVGAATRHHQPTASTPPPQHKSPPPATTSTPKPSPTPKGNPILANGVGCPKLSYPSVENADGNTDYTLNANIVDKSINQQPTPCGTGNPIKATGLTCKIWLSKKIDAPHKEQLNPVSNMQGAFPSEIQNAFNFDSGQQVQPCSQKGTTSWSYKLSPDLKSGQYYIAVIANYKGLVYNWYFGLITIQGQGHNGNNGGNN